MRLQLKRSPTVRETTIGLLFVDTIFECYILEDAIREPTMPPVFTGITRADWVASWKIKNRTAIPTGTYSVVIDDSIRFKRKMPHILDVPGFEGIRIHTGNTDLDTDGCPIVGANLAFDSVINSRLAFNSFFPKLESALNGGDDVSITVTNEQAAV